MADAARVLICDNSAVIRMALSRMLQADPAIRVVGRVANGKLAVDEVRRQSVDVVVLDIEMPVMDGLTALPLLLQADPGLRVVMASTLTTRGGDIAIRALRLGAADYVPKPDTAALADDTFRRELLAKVKGLARLRRRPAHGPSGLPGPRPTVPVARPAARLAPQLLAIGSSTGGPQALFTVLRALGTSVRLPVVITQHMPATFMPILAEHITKLGGMPCAEAQEGEMLRAGRIYLAPGDRHLLIEQAGGGLRARLSAAPPENSCRPARGPDAAQRRPGVRRPGADRDPDWNGPGRPRRYPTHRRGRRHRYRAGRADQRRVGHAGRRRSGRIVPRRAATRPDRAAPAGTSTHGRCMTPASFDFVAALLRARSGLVIGPDKLYLLEVRLGPILKREGLRDLDALADRLRASAAEPLVRAVVEAMTTNESFFFRDDKPFAHVRAHALPTLFASRPPGAPVRIWSAASSSGQEAYSLAMIVSDMRAAAGQRRVEIVGTDLAREQLARAAEGLYSQFEIQRGLPMQMLVRYFRKDAAGWRAVEALRGMVQFREWNLLSDLRPLGQFDIVFCRNVLIYFDQPTKARVLEAIARQMPADGLLYLGGSETVLGITDRFVPLPGERGVYGLAPATRTTPTLRAAAA